MKYYFSLLLVFSLCRLQAQEMYFYVGSATDEIPDPISLCSIDLSNGQLKKVQSFEGTKSSSYLCLSPKGDFLYSVDSESQVPGSKDHSVASFKIDKKSKALSLINKTSVEGRGACHVSVTSDNKFVMVANYGSGNVVVVPVGADGSLTAASSNIQHAGTGPDESRQQGPHAHYIQASANDKYVFAVDLGIDKVMNYTLSGDGELSENPNQAFLKLDPGVGPRHMVFHPNGKFAYVLNELTSSISACTYDKTGGKLVLMGTHPMLPEDFTEFSKAAAIRVHPSGKFLYGSNRGHDSIAVFEIQKDGNLNRVQIIQDGIEWPRDYNITPDGKYMVLANRHKNEIRTFTIAKDGKLATTESVIEIAQPTSVVFLGEK